MPSSLPPKPDLDFNDLYRIHRAHVAVDAAIGALGRRWGRDTLPVLVLRTAAAQLSELFWVESSPEQRDAISPEMIKELQANDARLAAALEAMRQKPG